MALNGGAFPSRANHVRGLWLLVLMCPHFGSPEQLVIGVAAANQRDFHLAEANAWRRLRCLFEEGAETALLAARVALDTLRSDLAVRGLAALQEPKETFSGISFGPLREGEGQNLKQLCDLWMQSLSSLYDPSLAAKASLEVEVPTLPSEGVSQKLDRLPILVLQYVESKRPGLAEFFNPELRIRFKRSRKPRAQDIYIGYAGSRLVANDSASKSV